MDFSRHHTITSAAIRLGITRQQVHHLLVAGTLAGDQVEPYPGARPVWRVERASVEHYAANRPRTGRPRRPAP